MRANYAKAVLSKDMLDAVNRESDKRFKELLTRYNREAGVQMLAVLHFYFGWGKKRLRRFTEALDALQQEIEDFYGLPFADTPSICEIKLREKGLDPDELLRSEGEPRWDGKPGVMENGRRKV